MNVDEDKSRIKAKTVYETSDGKEFDTEVAAKRHLEYLERLERITAIIVDYSSGLNCDDEYETCATDHSMFVEHFQTSLIEHLARLEP